MVNARGEIFAPQKLTYSHTGFYNGQISYFNMYLQNLLCIFFIKPTLSYGSKVSSLQGPHQCLPMPAFFDVMF